MNNNLTKILLVDDDRVFSTLVSRLFNESGYNIVVAPDLAIAKQELLKNSFDLVLLDQHLPDGTGANFLKTVKNIVPSLPVVMVSSADRPNLVVRCIKNGAESFFSKDQPSSELLKLAKHIEEEFPKTKTESRLPLVIEQSYTTKKLTDNLKKIAPLDSTVLLTGETGTGKSVFSSFLHRHSNRANKPFISVNCAAVPPSLIEAELFGYEKGAFTGAIKSKAGLFESANEGTLFLDEIGELGYDIQSKLLLFLQDKTVKRVGSNEERKLDVRIVAATNRNLEEMVDKKLFRADLLFRINVLSFEIPPLRNRQEMILPLAERKVTFLSQKWGKQLSLSQGARKLLKNHSWPGNIRELENAVERAAALAPAELIQAADFEANLRIEVDSFSSRENDEIVDLSNLEKNQIKKALEICQGHRAKASKMLGISERSIYEKIKKYSLQKVGRS